MNPKQNKLKNTLKIRSYMDIKKMEVCGNQKTGAKPASPAGGLLGGARQGVFQELSSCWRGLKGLKGKVVLKKGLALTTIVAVIVTAYFQGAPMASAATFTMSQPV